MATYIDGPYDLSIRRTDFATAPAAGAVEAASGGEGDEDLGGAKKSGIGESPGSARAQERLPVIAYIDSGSRESNVTYMEALREGLRALGYVKGQNIVIIERYGDGDEDRRQRLAEELVSLAPDVVVTSSSPVAAALGDTAPVVMRAGSLASVLERRLIESVGRPGGNVMGPLGAPTEFRYQGVAKSVEVARDMVPGTPRIGLLMREDDPRNEPRWEFAQEAAALLGVEALLVTFRSAADFDAAFADLARERVGVVVVPNDNIVYANGPAIIAAAEAVRMPTLYSNRGSLEDGLAHYSRNYIGNMRIATGYVARILEGANPAEMAIELIQVEMRINLNAAARIGFTFPASILARAEQVIDLVEEPADVPVEEALVPKVPE